MPSPKSIVKRLVTGAVFEARKAAVSLDVSPAIPAMGSHIYAEQCTTLCTKLHAMTGGAVYGGPFAGMRVPLRGAFAWQPNTVVGCYEAELHDDVVRCIVRRPSCVVNIGSGSGYYAVGLARSISGAHVIAFDSDPACHQVCAELAEVNGVKSRVTQLGACTVAALRDALSPDALVVCDCEGGEYELLDPVAVPELTSSTILCELHDFYDDRITPALIKRFATSHSIEIRTQRHRNPADSPILDGLSARERWLATHENRFVGSTPTVGRYMVLTPLAS